MTFPMATMTKKSFIAFASRARPSGPSFAPSFRHRAAETAAGTSTSRLRVSDAGHGGNSPSEEDARAQPNSVFQANLFSFLSQYKPPRARRSAPPLPTSNDQLTEDGGRVDGGGGSDAAVGRGAELELAVDATDREGQAGPGRARDGLLLVARGALAGAERALRVFEGFEEDAGMRGAEGGRERKERRGKKSRKTEKKTKEKEEGCILSFRLALSLTLAPFPDRPLPARPLAPFPLMLEV